MDKKKYYFILPLIAIPLLFDACKSRQSNSELKVKASDVRFVTAKNPIPAVVKIKSPVGDCGGSIVSTDTVLWAAHCVSEYLMLKDDVLVPSNKKERWCIVAGPYKGNCTTAVMVLKSWRPEDVDKFQPNDIALLRFRPNTFADYMTVITPEKALNAANIFLVGYSDIASTAFERMVLRLSKRWLKTSAPLPMTLSTGPTLRVVDTFNTAEVDSGDSGGPMLNESCEQIGVISSEDRYAVSFPGSDVADLRNPVIQEFFAKMAKEGKAHVCGIPETPAKFCPEGNVLVPRPDGEEFPCARKNPHTAEALARYFELEHDLNSDAKFVVINSREHLGIKLAEKLIDKKSVLMIEDIASSSPLHKYGVEKGWMIFFPDRQWPLSLSTFEERIGKIFLPSYAHTNFDTFDFQPPLNIDVAQASTKQPASTTNAVTISIFSRVEK